MRWLTSSAAALAADRAAETEFGYPPGLLMEEAGIRLQEAIDRRWPSGAVAYLVGSGNNGGDALVMARHAFLRGRTVAVVQVFDPASELCRLQSGLAIRAGVPMLAWPSDTASAFLSSADVWVDGLYGTGLAASLRAERAEILVSLEALRATLGKPCLAIDVPSGLWGGWKNGEAVLHAALTMAPGWAKDFCFLPETRELCGTIEELPLAFPRTAEPSAQWLEESDLAGLLPPVNPGDHKGRRGHVAVIGGAAGMTGAAVLAARSAAASGAGLVSLGCDAEVIAVIAPQVPAFQVRTAAEIAARAARLDAMVVGPGWGRGSDRPALLEMLWGTGVPLVVDADGLSAWKSLSLRRRESPVVLTPHPGEFARLTEPGSHSVSAAASLASEHGVCVILKGAVTWVLAPDGRRAVWDGSNPALATGGSGDCLAGVVGALLARGLGAFEAAAAAVALHGTAGRRLAAEAGWFTAERLPEALARTAAACMVPRLGL